jgi:hypothetical protein
MLEQKALLNREQQKAFLDLIERTMAGRARRVSPAAQEESVQALALLLAILALPVPAVRG